MDHGVYVDDGMPALMTTTYRLQGSEAYGYNMLRKMDTNKPNIKKINLQTQNFFQFPHVHHCHS